MRAKTWISNYISIDHVHDLFVIVVKHVEIKFRDKFHLIKSAQKMFAKLFIQFAFFRCSVGLKRDLCICDVRLVDENLLPKKNRQLNNWTNLNINNKLLFVFFLFIFDI